jgi:hypothetical protein
MIFGGQRLAPGTRRLEPSHAQAEKMSISSRTRIFRKEPALSAQRKALPAFAVRHGAVAAAFFRHAGMLASAE